MSEIKSKSYMLRTAQGNWLGQIVLTTNGMFAAVTDYGNLSYTWGSTGKEDFREFIIGISTEYLAAKLQNGLSYIAYTNKTAEACKCFSEKILPPLQKILKEELSKKTDW